MRGEFTFPIPQKPSGESSLVKISQTPSAKLPLTQKGQKPTSQTKRIVQSYSAQLIISAKSLRKSPIAIRWSHYALFNPVREQKAGV